MLASAGATRDVAAGAVLGVLCGDELSRGLGLPVVSERGGARSSKNRSARHAATTTLGMPRSKPTNPNNRPDLRLPLDEFRLTTKRLARKILYHGLRVAVLRRPLRAAQVDAESAPVLDVPRRWCSSATTRYVRPNVVRTERAIERSGMLRAHSFTRPM